MRMEKQFFTIDGNTARQLVSEDELPVYGNVLPVPEAAEPQPEIREPERERRIGRAVRRNRRNIAYLTRPFIAYLGVMVVVLFLAVAALITVSGQITGAEKKLASLSAELNAVKADNSAARVYMEKAVDVNEVYRIAVGEYGMVYPNKEQVVYYRQSESSYVVQNEEIPTD